MNVLSKRAYIVLFLGDISVLYTAVWLTLIVRHFAIPSVDTALIHLVSFSFLFVVWFIVYFLVGLYGRYTLLFRRQLPNVLFVAQAINVALAALFFFSIPVFQITPKVVLAIYLVVSTLLLYFWRVYVYPHLLVRREIGAVLIGTSRELSQLAEEVNKDPLYPLEFRAIVHPELSSSEDVRSIVRTLLDNSKVSAIVADMGNRSIDELLRFIYDTAFVARRVGVIDARKLYQEIFRRIPLSLIDERWVLRHLSLEEHLLYAVVKRMFDVSVGFILGVLSLLVYPFIIVAIYLDDRRGPFVTQTRIGRGGAPIRITKFRSMTGSDTGTEVLSSALAITRVGRFLRRTRLDELPQLWDVVRGDLSFVGPRPELPALVREYRARIPHYHLRHIVKPGLSGWAQTQHDGHAHHGVDVAATYEKLSYDLYYMKERSLWFDLVVCV